MTTDLMRAGMRFAAKLFFCNSLWLICRGRELLHME